MVLGMTIFGLIMQIYEVRQTVTFIITIFGLTTKCCAKRNQPQYVVAIPRFVMLKP